MRDAAEGLCALQIFDVDRQGTTRYNALTAIILLIVLIIIVLVAASVGGDLLRVPAGQAHRDGSKSTTSNGLLASLAAAKLRGTHLRDAI
jgi:hypothetical protein